MLENAVENPRGAELPANGTVVAVGEYSGKVANVVSNVVRIGRSYFGGTQEGARAIVPGLSEVRNKQLELDQARSNNPQNQSELSKKNKELNDNYQALDDSLGRAGKYWNNVKKFLPMAAMILVSMNPMIAVAGPLLVGAVCTMCSAAEQYNLYRLGMKTSEEAWKDFGWSAARFGVMAVSFSLSNYAFAIVAGLTSRAALMYAPTAVRIVRNSLGMQRGALRAADSFRRRGIFALPKLAPRAGAGGRGILRQLEKQEIALRRYIRKYIGKYTGRGGRYISGYAAGGARKLGEGAKQIGGLIESRVTALPYGWAMAHGTGMFVRDFLGCAARILGIAGWALMKLLRFLVPIEGDATVWNGVQYMSHKRLGTEADLSPSLTPMYNLTQAIVFRMGGKAEPNDDLISYATGLNKLLVPDGKMCVIYLGEFNDDIMIVGDRYDGVKVRINLDTLLLSYTDSSGKKSDIMLGDEGVRAKVVPDAKKKDLILYVDDGERVARISQKAPCDFTVTEGGAVPEEGEWVVNNKEENYNYAVHDKMAEFFMGVDPKMRM